MVVPSPKPIRFAPASVRRLKMPSGTRGECERVSMTRNAAMRMAEPVKLASVCQDVQPTFVVCVRP